MPPSISAINFAVLDYFNQCPHVSKLPRGYTLQVAGRPYVLTQSYLQTREGRIFAVEPKHQRALIGKGNFGRVKHASEVLPDGQMNAGWVVKICHFQSNESAHHATGLAGLNGQHEASIWQGQGHAAWTLSRRHPETEKGYVFLKHLGDNLQQVLISQRPDFAARLDYAIQLGVAVLSMHIGKASLLEQPYAQRDIKQANALIDSAGRLILADFGLVAAAPHLDSRNVAGTPVNLPPAPTNYTLEQLDTIAFLRTVNEPPVYRCHTPGGALLIERAAISIAELAPDEPFDADDTYANVLNDAELQRFHLTNFFNTQALHGPIMPKRLEVIVAALCLAKAVASLQITDSQYRQTLLMLNDNPLGAYLVIALNESSQTNYAECLAECFNPASNALNIARYYLWLNHCLSDDMFTLTPGVISAFMQHAANWQGECGSEKAALLLLLTQGIDAKEGGRWVGCADRASHLLLAARYQQPLVTVMANYQPLLAMALEQLHCQAMLSAEVWARLSALQQTHCSEQWLFAKGLLFALELERDSRFLPFDASESSINLLINLNAHQLLTKERFRALQALPVALIEVKQRLLAIDGMQASFYRALLCCNDHEFLCSLVAIIDDEEAGPNVDRWLKIEALMVLNMHGYATQWKDATIDLCQLVILHSAEAHCSVHSLTWLLSQPLALIKRLPYDKLTFALRLATIKLSTAEIMCCITLHFTYQATFVVNALYAADSESKATILSTCSDLLFELEGLAEKADDKSDEKAALIVSFSSALKDCYHAHLNEDHRAVRDNVTQLTRWFEEYKRHTYFASRSKVCQLMRDCLAVTARFVEGDTIANRYGFFPAAKACLSPPSFTIDDNAENKENQQHHC